MSEDKNSVPRYEFIDVSNGYTRARYRLNWHESVITNMPRFMNDKVRRGVITVRLAPVLFGRSGS